MSALIVLDSIVRSLSLTSLDAGNHHTSLFSARSVPTVQVEHDHQSQCWDGLDDAHLQIASSSGSNTPFYPTGGSPRDGGTLPSNQPSCSCTALALASHWNGTMEHAPLWASTPAWSSSDEGEIRKESCRRLCWSTMTMSAGHLSYTATHSAHSKPPDLFITNPANVSCLIPSPQQFYLRYILMDFYVFLVRPFTLRGDDCDSW
jgi:hypothetical protein